MRNKKIFDWWSGSNANIIDVAVLWGQSNMRGDAEIARLMDASNIIAGVPGNYTTTPPGKIWSRTTYADYIDNGSWQDLEVGVNNRPGVVQNTQFGVETTLAQDYYELTGRTLYMIKFGDTSFIGVHATNADWAPSSSHDFYQRFFANFFNPAISTLIDEGYQVRVVAIIQHIGESTAADPTHTANISTDWTTLKNAFRAESPLLATCPWICTKIFYEGAAGEPTVNAAFDTFASTVPNTYSVDPASQCVIGKRKMDLSALIKSTYPPTGTDDTHNSFEFFVKASQIHKGVIQSANSHNSSPVTEDFGFEVERAYDRAVAASITLPSNSYFTNLDQLVDDIKQISANRATFKKIVGMWMLDNTGSQNFGTINIKNPLLSLATFVSSPSWVSGVGVGPFNKTSQYFDSNLNIATALTTSGYSNFCMISYVEAIATLHEAGVFQSGSINDMYFTHLVTRFWEAGGHTHSAPVGTAVKFLAASRSDGNNVDFYIDADKDSFAGTRTGTFSSTPIWGYNRGFYGDQTQRVCIYGQGMTEAEVLGIRTALISYKARL